MTDDPRVPTRRWPSVLVLAAATALGLAATLPAVWWEPLHLDERVTLAFSPHSPVTILREIFVDRGGAPLQFLVEHATLTWPGGLLGLRLPSVIFFVLAVAFTAPVVRALVGPNTSLIATVLLALAPLAVGLATFARMYALLLWLVLATAWLSLRAGRTGSPRDWLLAGAIGGALVYAHPIAPLYALPAFACGLTTSGLPLRAALAQARRGFLAGVVVALPYAYALTVLRSRYDVGEAGRLTTTAGRSVPEQALYALTAGGTVGLVVLAVLALVGVLRLLRDRPRVGALLAVWVLLPVLFFTLVPAQTRFFDRYVLAALPAFLALVGAGCVTVARRPVAIVLLTAALLALEGADDVGHLRALRRLDLGGLPRPVAGQVLFSATGLPRSDRPPELLDDLLALRSPGAWHVEELPAIDPRYDATAVPKGVANVRTFLGGSSSATGLWVFRGSERRIAAAVRRLAGDPDLTTHRVGLELLVVRCRRAVGRHLLITLGLRVRLAWGTTTPSDRWPRTIARIDRTALS